MTEKLLSICIGTYNRSDYLIQNLDVLLPQLKGLEDAVELLISDNHSTDSEYQKLCDYLKQVDFPFSLFRQEKNIGGEPNVFSVSDKARGDYLFLLGDDDLLSPNFIEIVFPYVKQKKYSIIHWNRLVGDENCNNNYLHTKDYTGLVNSLNVKELILQHTLSLTFMSSLIISREAWLSGEAYVKDRYYGYKWFCRTIAGALVLESPTLYYYMPLVIQRNPPKVWAKDWPLYWIIGLSGIYKDFDVKANGIYDNWKKVMRMRTSLHDMIVSLSKDQEYYKQYEEEFALYLDPHEQKELHYWLHVKRIRIAWFLESLHNRWNRLFR